MAMSPKLRSGPRSTEMLFEFLLVNAKRYENSNTLVDTQDWNRSLMLEFAGLYQQQQGSRKYGCEARSRLPVAANLQAVPQRLRFFWDLDCGNISL